MTAQPGPNNLLSKREEEQLIETGRRVLLNGGYPNPDRVGCPGSAVLKSLAERKVDIRQAEDSVLHIGMCSPCFIEYTEFRKQVQWRRSAIYVGVAASLAVVIFAIGWWGWRASHPTVITTHHQIVADLRGRFTPRGEEGTKPGKGPLVFERGIDDVTIYLPEGSRAGAYEVAIFREGLGEPLARAAAVATVQNGVATMNATLDLSHTPEAYYLLGLRLPGIEWSYYPLSIR